MPHLISSLHEDLLDLLDLVVEIGALVLVDELGNPLGLSLARSSNRSGVGLVGQAKVKMMGRALDIEGYGLIVDFLRDTTSLPRVELTVGEDDVGSLQEVTLGYTTTKVVKSPVVLRELAVLSGALHGGFLLAPCGSGEHRSFRITRERHDHLVASHDRPAVVIEATALGDSNI